MWQEYNPNPTGRSVGDCAVRAVAKALDVDWEQAYLMLAKAGLEMGDLMNEVSVWGALLRKNGMYRKTIPNECPDCYTAADFIKDNPVGTFVLGFDKHAATVKDGILYDSFNSLNEIPIFVWYRKDENNG